MNQTSQDKYLVAYGLGGCWSGFTHAAIMEARSIADAEEAGLVRALDEFSEHKSRGVSSCAEKITTSAADTSIYTRLKLTARNMLGPHKINLA